MAGKKSKHGKKKYYQPTQKAMNSQPNAAAPMAAAARQPAATPAPAAQTPPAARTPAAAASKIPQTPYITSELRNIGILTAIILVVLIVLSRIFA
jgi:hypothetical protein